MVLRRTPGPLEALAVEPDFHAPLVERAVDDVLAALSSDVAADPLAVSVDALLRALAAAPASTLLKTSPAVLDPREVTVPPGRGTAAHELRSDRPQA